MANGAGISTEAYQPKVTRDHSLPRVGDNLYLWAGNWPGFPSVHSSEEKKSSTSVVDIFHLPTGRWQRRPTTGNPPLGVREYASAVIDREIFFFGGLCNHDKCYHNSLYSLNVDTLVWKELSPTNSHCGPMLKSSCGMIAVQFDGEDYLLIIGGYFSLSNNPPRQHNAQYKDNRTNEIHYYKISTGEWISPTVTGTRPPSCNAFTLTPMSNNSAVLFGGSCTNTEYSNTAYVGEFTKSQVTWKRISKPSNRSVWPNVRWGLSSVLITSAPEPHLLIVGGKPAFDCWLLNINKGVWKKLTLPPFAIERYLHSLSVWNVTPSTSWIVEFGGATKQQRLTTSNANIIELIYSNTEWSVKTFPLDKYQEKLAERRKEQEELSQPSPLEKEKEIEQPPPLSHHQLLPEKEREIERPSPLTHQQSLLEKEREIERLYQELQKTKEQVQTGLQQQLNTQLQLQERGQQLQESQQLIKAKDEQIIQLERNQQDQERKDHQLQSKQQIQDTPSLLKLMNDIAASAPNSWRNIGICLEFSHEQLNGIDGEYHGKPMNCYSAVFSRWSDSCNPPYTWETILNCLESPLVGRRDIAERIRKKYANK